MVSRTILFVLLGILVLCVLILVVWTMALGPSNAITTVILALTLLLAGGIFLAHSTAESLDASVRKAERRAELFEREIRRQKEVVDALADGLDVAIFLCDHKTIVDYANRKAVELFEFEEPRGRSILDVTLSDDLRSIVQQARDRKTPQDGELTFRYPVERVGLCKAWVDPTNAERVFVTIYEITNLRRLERARRDFVANVSHELRTPMTTIRAMSETLLDGDDEDYKVFGNKYLSRIIREVDRLTLISDDLLTLSVAESQQVTKSQTNLAEIVQVAVSNLSEKADAKRLSLITDSPPIVQILANAHQMAQVVVNLIDNAINYTNEGTVTVTVGLEGSEAFLTVKDTGIGIPQEEQLRIFERFYRVDKGRSRATGGTGLGLSIVKHIVESHGGRVTLVSEVGQGTAFTIWLPQA